MFYKVILEYDGSLYFGFQDQKDVVSVCGELKKGFLHAFKTDCSIAGASRTDAGVHAKGQVLRVSTQLNIKPGLIKELWNRVLPGDIRILQVEACDIDFHPQHNVLEKTYIYKVFINSKPPISIQRFGYFYEYQIEMEKLEECLKIFVGTHDFRSFCTGDDMESTVRTINSIEINTIEKDSEFDIVFKGESFLRYMIRRIVGASLETASKKKAKIEDLKKALESKNAAQCFWTAQGKGLTLYEIKYK